MESQYALSDPPDQAAGFSNVIGKTPTHEAALSYGYETVIYPSEVATTQEELSCFSTGRWVQPGFVFPRTAGDAYDVNAHLARSVKALDEVWLTHLSYDELDFADMIRWFQVASKAQILVGMQLQTRGTAWKDVPLPNTGSDASGGDHPEGPNPYRNDLFGTSMRPTAPPERQSSTGADADERQAKGKARHPKRRLPDEPAAGTSSEPANKRLRSQARENSPGSESPSSDSL